MKYEILGPLRVVTGIDSYSISAQKVEVLLRALLINAGLVLTVDQLMNEIWGDSPPRRAAATLQVYVSQLRKFLSRVGRGDSAIVTRPAGYLLHLGADELDVHTFTRRVREGRGYARSRQHDKAKAAIEAALSLYRGPALGDLHEGPILNQFALWLDETRLECIELLIDANLALGCHREVVGRLYSLVAEHPFRESLYRLLMLALYRSERQADALKVYQAARLTLRGELGIEPCRRLRDLQQAILTADERLEYPTAV